MVQHSPKVHSYYSTST